MTGKSAEPSVAGCVKRRDELQRRVLLGGLIHEYEAA
jgi:hypothetical protein